MVDIVIIWDDTLPIETNNALEGEKMNNSSVSMAYLPLAVVGIMQLAAIRVPDGVNAFAFYGSAALAALAIIGIAAAAIKWRNFAYALGWAFALGLLAMAVAILIDLPPYVAPTN